LAHAAWTKPGGETAIRNALRSLAAPSRIEKGCLLHELSPSATDPTVFVTIERWTDQDALDARWKTGHVASAVATAGEYLTGEPVTQLLIADHV
jgi:quinol monooxygenase YgiN